MEIKYVIFRYDKHNGSFEFVGYKTYREIYNNLNKDGDNYKITVHNDNDFVYFKYTYALMPHVYFNPEQYSLFNSLNMMFDLKKEE